MDHPQAGQNAAFGAICAAQCGHPTVAGVAFIGALAGLFGGLNDSPSIALLSAVVAAAVFVSAVFVSTILANTINLKSVACSHVMVLVSNFLFDLSNLLGEKFD